MIRKQYQSAANNICFLILRNWLNQSIISKITALPYFIQKTISSLVSSKNFKMFSLVSQTRKTILFDELTILIVIYILIFRKRHNEPRSLSTTWIRSISLDRLAIFQSSICKESKVMLYIISGTYEEECLQLQVS